MLILTKKGGRSHLKLWKIPLMRNYSYRQVRLLSNIELFTHIHVSDIVQSSNYLRIGTVRPQRTQSSTQSIPLSSVLRPVLMRQVLGKSAQAYVQEMTRQGDISTWTEIHGYHLGHWHSNWYRSREIMTLRRGAFGTGRHWPQKGQWSRGKRAPHLDRGIQEQGDTDRRTESNLEKNCVTPKMGTQRLWNRKTDDTDKINTITDWALKIIVNQPPPAFPAPLTIWCHSKPFNALKFKVQNTKRTTKKKLYTYTFYYTCLEQWILPTLHHGTRAPHNGPSSLQCLSRTPHERTDASGTQC